MISAADLARTPNPLAAHYRRFRVDERLLLTGHSHQAWPDVAWEGQLRAIEDAAELVDGKWARAEQMAEGVRRGYARLLQDTEGDYALGASTHELLLRFLSALPLRRRPRLVTTDGEFHSMRRQLARLEEEGLEVVRVPARPADGVAEALCREVDGRTAAVLVSAVFFQTAEIVPGLDEVARACQREGAELLVDAYHALNVLPYPIAGLGLSGAHVVGGGYKYCQLGEGCCFLRLPPACTLRPAITGWFAEFGALSAAGRGESVAYPDGAARFAGSTYDPTSHYRGARVFDFFAEMGLSPKLLRGQYQRQLALLVRGFDALDADPALIRRPQKVPLDRLGGFLVLRTPKAPRLHAALARRGLHTDFRGDALRLGPAPYHSDRQLHDAVAILGEAIAEVAR